MHKGVEARNLTAGSKQMLGLVKFRKRRGAELVIPWAL